MQQQLAQQKAIEAAQEASGTDSSKRLQFKWAEKATASSKQLQVKSLAQIQQEEQERIVKVKVLIIFSLIFQCSSSTRSLLKNNLIDCYLVAARKRTSRESGAERVSRCITKCWDMGHGFSVLELGQFKYI